MTKRTESQEMTMRRLGVAVRLLREKHGYSLREFSTKHKLNFSAVNRIENGVTLNPSVFFIEQLARAFGCTVDDLMKFNVKECPTCGGSGWVKK
jgi:transcriptional regulator with XRE-family HTH domain